MLHLMMVLIILLIKKNEKNDLIYIGCQILNKSLFKEYRVSNFSITKIWNNLRKENKLNGFQSKKKPKAFDEGPWFLSMLRFVKLYIQHHLSSILPVPNIHPL